MKMLLLLLLGWAMVGQGMGGDKGSNSFSEVFKKDLEKEALELDHALDVLKKWQPKDKIKIKINTGDIPDCHHPHQIIQTHIRRVESISDFVFCCPDCQIKMIPVYTNLIRVSLITSATEKMCAQYFKKRGCIKKFEHQLYIVPPQIEHKFVSCLIEHPIDKKFKIEQIHFETFMKRFEKEPEIPVSDSSDDSSDFDLSSEEEEKPE